MKGLLVQDVRKEIVSLLDQCTEELQDGSPQVAVSMLMEAQFLLGDAIQNELNRIQNAPLLVPAGDESAEGAECSDADIIRIGRGTNC